MQRRLTFVLLFLLFAAGIAWYASTHMTVPESSFTDAAKVGDSKKKILVTGRLAEKEIVPEGKALTFYMVDRDGIESKVFYDGQEEIEAATLADAKNAGRNVSVAGHTCGDRFHVSMITLR